MTNESIHPRADSFNEVGQNEDNQEWELSDLVDIIAAEVDQAQDTLSLKSYARGICFAIKKLSLDLEVKVRRTNDGRLLFRTVDADESSATILKLDFAQVLQGQLADVRKPLDHEIVSGGFGFSALRTLSQFASEAERSALGNVGIHSVDDLERYTQTAPMIAELARKTNIPEYKIRLWQQLPFIQTVKPDRGAPGSTVVIEGGNFGEQAGSVFFQQTPVTLLNWQNSRITIEIPAQVAPIDGVLVVQIEEQRSNAVAWSVIGVDLVVQDILIEPTQPTEEDEITAQANLINQGILDAQPFEVQWEIDDRKQAPQPHGLLRSQQQSAESTTRYQFKRNAGTYILRFTADPAQKLPDAQRQQNSFSKQIQVRPVERLRIGDFRTIDTFNPLLTVDSGPAGVLSLMFRGLAQRSAVSGTLIPDLAASWKVEKASEGSTFLIIELQEDLQFHNGTGLTATDVESTYKMVAAQLNFPWNPLVKQTITQVRGAGKKVGFKLQPEIASYIRTAALDNPSVNQLLAEILTIGILPQTYELDPEGFAQRPVGSGPFYLKRFLPNEMIQLGAFRQYKPDSARLDQIDISINLAIDELIRRIEARTIDVAILPYSRELEERFQNGSHWTARALLDQSPPLLQVQILQLYERSPNRFNTNWNAHLWYIKRHSDGG